MSFYKIDEVDSHRFYKTPKVLFINRCYRNTLSSDSKLIYSLLLDRMHLSKKNKWINKSGEVYLNYTKEKIAATLGMSESTVYKSFKHLEKLDLIRQERQGLNKPNKIYVGKIDSSLKPTLKSDGNIDECGICKFCSSEPVKCTGQDLLILQGNDTDLSETEYSETLKGNSSNTEISIPFKDYCDKYTLSDDVRQAIEYYLYTYEGYTNQDHHNYKPSTWRYIADQLLTVELDKETVSLSTDDEAMMIDKHFNTTYKDCNYHLTHYVSDKVRELRYYEMIKPIKG